MLIENENSAAETDWSLCLSEVAESQNKIQFMKLYDFYAPRLKSWLQGMARDADVAEELAQETLLMVWRKAHQYDATKAAVSTWIFRIARNLYLDQLRRDKARKLREDSTADLVEDRTADAGDLMVDSSRLKEAIKELPPNQAQLLYQSYFEGKSHQQIADETGMPLGSVKSTIRLAFQKLEKAMRS